MTICIWMNDVCIHWTKRYKLLDTVISRDGSHPLRETRISVLRHVRPIFIILLFNIAKCTIGIHKAWFQRFEITQKGERKMSPKNFPSYSRRRKGGAPGQPGAGLPLPLVNALRIVRLVVLFQGCRTRRYRRVFLLSNRAGVKPVPVGIEPSL